MHEDAPHKGWHRRGYLPHFDMPGLYQFLTFRLADSLPAGVSRTLHESSVLGSEAFHETLDEHLDSCHGACILRKHEFAEIVQAALLHFDGERYEMHAWVIMPNHVHALLRVMSGSSLGKIVKSWKAFTGAQINKLLGTNGEVWQPDYFDRMIRDEEHFHRTAEYIEYNPVKARLAAKAEDWRFSSAYVRSVSL